jgi:hypothetical protein
MAPRAYWKGYPRLSLVTCPVELHPATSLSERTHFHMINRKTHHRLSQQMVDDKTGGVVDREHRHDAALRLRGSRREGVFFAHPLGQDAAQDDRGPCPKGCLTRPPEPSRSSSRPARPAHSGEAGGGLFVMTFP